MRKIHRLKIFCSLSLIIGSAIFITSPTFAEEAINRQAIPLPDDTTEIENINDGAINEDTAELYNTVYIEGEEDTINQNEADEYDIKFLEEATAEDETDTSNDENDEEVSAWPMLISFIALGTTAIIVVIINLLGRRKA